MIFEVISAVAISVSISFIMSLGVAYIMHRRITIDDVDGLKFVLEGKADSRHGHHSADVYNLRDDLYSLGLLDYEEDEEESDES